METQHYQPQERQTPVLSEKKPLKKEMKKAKSKEKSWFYYRCSDLIGETTEALEEALARLEEQKIHRRHMDFIDSITLSMAKYSIGFELLMRKNPKARELRDAYREICERKYKAQKAWEKEVLAREGEEGLKRRKQNGEGPGRAYTREELDIRVRLVQAEVDAGIQPTSALKYAIAVRDAGGFYQWDKERKRKNAEFNIRQLAAVNHPKTGEVLENIRRLNEIEYGKDYALAQHVILADLAFLPSQNRTTPTSDTPTP